MNRLQLKIAVQICFEIFLLMIAQKAVARETVDTHCKTEEVIYFSCEIKKIQKTASLCGNNANSSAGDPNFQSSLVYRYGFNSTIEFQYPADVLTVPVFQGEHLKPYGENITMDTIRFDVNGVSHGIAIRSGKEKFTGIWIADRKGYRELSCQGNVIENSFHGLVIKLLPP